jgi:hypothetical protein
MMLWIIAVIAAVVLLDIPWKTGDPQYLVYTWTDDWAWSYFTGIQRSSRPIS